MYAHSLNNCISWWFWNLSHYHGYCDCWLKTNRDLLRSFHFGGHSTICFRDYHHDRHQLSIILTAVSANEMQNMVCITLVFQLPLEYCSVLWELKIYRTGAFVGLGLVFFPVTAVNWIALNLAPHPGPGILFPYHREQNPSDTGITVTYLYHGKVAVHGGAFLSLLSLFVCYHCTTMVRSGQVTSLWWGWKVSVKSTTAVLLFANIFPVVS